MTRIKVKLFMDSSYGSLEQKINQWLADEQIKRDEIVSIKYMVDNNINRVLILFEI